MVIYFLLYKYVLFMTIWGGGRTKCEILGTCGGTVNIVCEEGGAIFFYTPMGGQIFFDTRMGGQKNTCGQEKLPPPTT